MSHRSRRGVQNAYVPQSRRSTNDNTIEGNVADSIRTQKSSNSQVRGAGCNRGNDWNNMRGHAGRRCNMKENFKSDSDPHEIVAREDLLKESKPDSLETQDNVEESGCSTSRHGGIIQIPKELNIYTQRVKDDDGINFACKGVSHSKPVLIVRPHQKKTASSDSDLRSTKRYQKPPKPGVVRDSINYQKITPAEADFPSLRQSIQRYPGSSPNAIVGKAASDVLTCFDALNILMIAPGLCAPHMPPLSDEESEEKLAISVAERLFMRWWFSIKKLRENLFACFETLVLQDLDFCHGAQVELQLWKTMFYNLIELMRGWIDNPFQTELLSVPENCEDELKIDFEACESLVNLIKKILLDDVIEDGVHRYSELLQKLKVTYNVPLDHLLAEGRPPPDSSSRTVMLVYLCAQKISIFLGDLARYTESINKTQDFGKARSWYMKAQLIYPKNGRTYNQLGLLSIKSGRPFDAMCYYMRAIAASNPFQIATETLLALFHEHQERWNQISPNNPLKDQFHLGNRTTEARTASEAVNFVAEGLKNKIEIWIHPVNNVVTVVMGMNSLVVPRALLIHRNKKAKANRSRSRNDSSGDSLASDEESEEAQADAEEYANVPLVKLTKTFGLYFMHAHGLLFTKIGMETFPEVASTALQALSGLLAQEPCAVNCDRLYQILMANMFNLDRSSQSTLRIAASTTAAAIAKSKADSETLRSVHHDHAARFALDTFSLICRRATKLFNESRGSSPNSANWLHPDLKILLPALRLWTEWMVLHPEHWSPPPNYRDPILRPHLDEWRLVAEMCTAAARWIAKVKGAPKVEEITPTNDLVVQMYLRKQAEEQTSANGDNLGSQIPPTTIKYATLFEETVFAGFKPMLDLTPKLYQYTGEWDPDSVEQFVRIEKMVLFGDFLCGIETPVLNYEVDKGVYLKAVEPEERSVLEQPDHSDGSEEDKAEELLPHENANDENCKPYDSKEDDQEDVGDEEYRALLKRRNELLERAENNHRLEEWRVKAERRTAAGYSRAVEIEVRPVYIVPDTNCYIDWLEGVARLAQSSSNYTVLVPIIVFNELQYLASKARQQSLNPIENAFAEYLVNPTTNTKKGDMIQDRAKAAILYLECEFEQRNPRLRAITAQGNILETIAYRNELNSRQVDQNNDDIILDCCRHLCKEPLGGKSVNIPSQNQPMVLSRQVVLLTGDRTLRIKARCAYVPVTPLRPFVMWSNLKPVALPPEVEELISHPSRKSPSPTAASGKKPRKNRGRQK